jgi:hypothetical protein
MCVGLLGGAGLAVFGLASPSADWASRVGTADRLALGYGVGGTHGLSGAGSVGSMGSGADIIIVHVGWVDV